MKIGADEKAPVFQQPANLAGGNMEIKKTDQFFIENNDLIERMVTEREAFFARLRDRVAQLLTTIKDTAEAKALSQPPWIYCKLCLVLDFNFQKSYPIAFDLCLGPKGWELQLFGRNTKSSAYLASLLKSPPLNARVANATVADDRYIVQTWSLEADLGEIQESLRSWMRVVIESDAAAQI